MSHLHILTPPEVPTAIAATPTTDNIKGVGEKGWCMFVLTERSHDSVLKVYNGINQTGTVIGMDNVATATIYQGSYGVPIRYTNGLSVESTTGVAGVSEWTMFTWPNETILGGGQMVPHEAPTSVTVNATIKATGSGWCMFSLADHAANASLKLHDGSGGTVINYGVIGAAGILDGSPGVITYYRNGLYAVEAGAATWTVFTWPSETIM